MLATSSYDFSPHYLTDARFESAYRAYKEGKLAAAEKPLRAFLADNDSPAAEPGAKYLLVRILERRAKKSRKRKLRATMAAERLALLQELVGYAPLAGPVHYALARHYEERDDRAVAESHYAKIPASSAQQILARIAIVRMRIRSGAAKDALELIDGAKKARPSARQRSKLDLLRCQALLGMKRKKAAVAAYWRIWAAAPKSRAGKKAAAELAALRAGPTVSERATAHYAGIERGNRRALLGQLVKLRKTFRGTSKPTRTFIRAVAESVSKKHRKFAPRLFRKAMRARSPFIRGHAAYRLARTLERLDRPGKALTAYRSMAKSHSGHIRAADALARAANLARKLKRPREAAKLVTALVRDHADHPDRVAHLWNLGWNAWRQGDPVGAAAVFDRIAREEGARRHLGQATWGERALYWRGRSELAAKQRKRAVETFAHVVSRHPLTYYSHLAFNRLALLEPRRARRLRPHRALPPYDLASLLDLSRLSIRRHPSLDTAVELTRLGLYDDARRELAVQARAQSLDPNGLTLLASLALRQKKFGDTHRLIRWRGTLPHYPDVADERLWKMAYPLPYWEQVAEYSTRWGIDPFLVMALIRHESAYNPSAVSRANAVGLMQLLVGTARNVAKRLLRIPRPNAKTLRKPRLNILVGSRLLKELMLLFGGNEALALAAYNAGSGRARGWLKGALARGIHNTDELVEEIPFVETHSYVKSVLASYGAYRYVYGPRTDPGYRTIPLEVALPTELGPYFGKR